MSVVHKHKCGQSLKNNTTPPTPLVIYCDVRIFVEIVGMFVYLRVLG